DIERATEMARRMVCEFGMSQLGPLTYGKKDQEIFLGREIAQHRDYSEATAIKIDQEVRRFVDEGYARAKGCLVDGRETLIAIAEALLERETLDSEEVKTIIGGGKLPPVKPPSSPTAPAEADVQKVLKPEPGRAPGLQPGPSPA
ncbi:MAG: cell division protein FtsH, partial [Acidobacteriaceae bacterium]